MASPRSNCSSVIVRGIKGSNHVAEGAAGKDQETFLEADLHEGLGFVRRRLLGLSIPDQFQGEHGTLAPDIADDLETGLEFVETLPQFLSEGLRLGEDIFRPRRYP